jgi:hypothetical protein
MKVLIANDGYRGQTLEFIRRNEQIKFKVLAKR